MATINFSDIVKADNKFGSKPVRMNYIHDFSRDSNFGGLTIAYQIIDNGNRIEYGFSKCNPSDRYDKKIGREKATSRLVNHKGLRGAITIDDAICLLVNAFGSTVSRYFYSNLNFFLLGKQLINKIVLFRVIRKLGKEYWDYNNFMETWYNEITNSEDNLEVITVPCCASCPDVIQMMRQGQSEKVNDFDFVQNHCFQKKCDFKNLLLVRSTKILNEMNFDFDEDFEDEYEDEPEEIEIPEKEHFSRTRLLRIGRRNRR